MAPEVSEHGLNHRYRPLAAIHDDEVRKNICRLRVRLTRPLDSPLKDLAHRGVVVWALDRADLVPPITTAIGHIIDWCTRWSLTKDTPGREVQDCVDCVEAWLKLFGAPVEFWSEVLKRAVGLS